jgi:hypothetical protein
LLLLFLLIAQVMKKPLSDEQKEELIKMTQDMMDHISHLKYESGFTREKFEDIMRREQQQQREKQYHYHNTQTEQEIEAMRMFYDIA